MVVGTMVATASRVLGLIEATSGNFHNPRIFAVKLTWSLSFMPPVRSPGARPGGFLPGVPFPLRARGLLHVPLGREAQQCSNCVLRA
jgi:hypothetical protein